MKRAIVDRLRREEGVALVLVVFGVALLATLSVILVDTVTSESARSTKSVTRQSSFEAAEAGIDDYISKIAEDRAYYLHWVTPAESTRQDDGTGGTSNLVSPSGSSPAPSTWCRDKASRPAPVPWAYGATWLNSPNGKDHWCSLGNGYEYNLQITPPSATQPGVKIVSTGRRISNTADTRIIEAVVRQSSITDFQEIADGNIGWGANATSYGLIYANGDITWNSTNTKAYGSNFATGTISGGVQWQPGATGFDGDGSTSYTNLFAPPEPAQASDRLQHLPGLLHGHLERRGRRNRWRHLPELVLRLVAADLQRRRHHHGRGLHRQQHRADATDLHARGTRHPAGADERRDLLRRQRHRPRNRQGARHDRHPRRDPDRRQHSLCGRHLFHTTVLRAERAGARGDERNRRPVLDLGRSRLARRVALGDKTFGAWDSLSTGANCSNNHTSGNLMRHRGSSALKYGGSFTSWFDSRQYLYDDSLQYLPPPWFPTLDPDYEILSFRELPAS